MKQVLIVDDAVTVRMYHKDLMGKCGFATDEAANGIEALEKVLSKEFDLLIVDVNMPKMDGYRFVTEVRKNADIFHLPVIMVSTEAQSIDQQRSLSVGANHYIVKPAVPDALMLHAKLLVGEY
ncbi:MAG: response regulator [Glaciecola sp.]